MALPFADAARGRLGTELFRYVLGRPRDLAPDAPDANEAAFDRYRLVPHLLRGCSEVDIGAELCGRRFAGPLAIGPFAGDRVFHEDGLRPVARVCQRLNLPLIVSEETATPLPALTALHDGCWLQLRAAGPLDRVRRLADAAARCGAVGLVLTALAPVHPTPAPATPAPATPGAQPGGYAIGEEIARRGWSTIGSDAPGISALPAWPQWRWADIGALAAGLPPGLRLMVKGVLRAEDAVAAEEARCDGVIVANVGLRQCGKWALPLHALPDIRRRATRAVLLDGGVRSGADMVVACCLGADLAVVTRPIVTTLAGAGEAALHGLLAGWLDEVAAITGWLGAARLADLTPSHLRHDPAA
jgi:4-hydroxymandelate oxidase